MPQKVLPVILLWMIGQLWHFLAAGENQLADSRVHPTIRIDFWGGEGSNHSGSCCYLQLRTAQQNVPRAIVFVQQLF